MQGPPRWTEADLLRDAAESAEGFRKERLAEPLIKWKTEFQTRAKEFKELFKFRGIIHPTELSAADVVSIFESGFGDAFRYLAGPPISADDLKTLADVTSFTVANLTADEFAGAQTICEIFRASVDPERFPWLAKNEEPSDTEISVAVAASAALFAGQRVQTARRHEAKNTQEDAVKEFLRGMGFLEFDTPKQIRTLEDAPPRGHFCNECMVGTRKADVPIRLFDGRLMPLECKSSYSALNSIKRINNDAAVKARSWLEEFGTFQVVPAALLSGVFGVANLLKAQDGQLTLFWSHRLDAMREFIESTKT